MACTAKLRGHKASVCCVAVREADHLAVSSAEDGSVCSFDLRTHSLAARLQVADKDTAVPSVALHPNNHNLLFCCCDRSVLCLDLRKGGDGCMHRLNLNHEEVNSIAVNVKGTMLAAADDAGQVAVVDLATHSLMRMPRSGHANVASSVTFRDHRLWEVVSGGLDAVAVLWDFASGRQLKRWEFGREGGGENQMFNPPLVHCVATPHNAEHPFTRLVATARGDGAIAVFDADADANKSRKQNSAGLSTRPTVCNLSHAAAANHVSFPEAAGGRLALSGGNDGCILLQDWTTAAEPATQSSSSIDWPGQLKVRHGHKINCIASMSSSLQQLYVADVTRTLSVYTLL